MEDREYKALGTSFIVSYGSQDTELVYRVYERLWNLRKGHKIIEPLADRDRVFRMVTELNRYGNLAYFYYKGTLVGVVAFNINPDFVWWGYMVRAVEEVFVLSMSDDYAGFGRIAAQFLKDMCRENNCDLVFAGAFLGSNNSYKKIKGYSEEYPTYVCLRKDCDSSDG